VVGNRNRAVADAVRVIYNIAGFNRCVHCRHRRVQVQLDAFPRGCVNIYNLPRFRDKIGV
jgi:hypothetical protein